MLIKFNASDLRLFVDGDGIIPSGCVNTPDFTVSLSPEWEGYSVTAQFVGSGKTVHVAAIESGEVYPVPWECLTSAGRVSVSLIGIAGDKVKTGLPATLSVKESLVTQGSKPQPVTPDAYEQYVNRVEEIIAGAHNEFEQLSNKTNSVDDVEIDKCYPTVKAVLDYIDSCMLDYVEDDMANQRVWGITMPSAVAKYVLEKTRKPTWHKTTVNITDDDTLVVTLKNLKCVGAKAFIKTLKGSADCDISLNMISSGGVFFCVDGSKYISAANDETYGVLTAELINGMWDGGWTGAAQNSNNIWSSYYKPRFSYRNVTSEDYPFADTVIVRAVGNTNRLPNGSVIEIWLLY